MRNNKTSFWKLITRNWGLKVASFVFALILWLFVANVNDPTIKYTWNNIPVTIENAKALTDQGLIYEVLEGTDVVPKVTIYAPKSVIQSIDKSDIVATADLSQINSMNSVAIDFSVNRYSSSISSIRGSVEALKVNIENRKSAVLGLETNILGSAPDGYVVGNVSTDQNLIRVSGPESVVNRIRSAAINVDMSLLSGFTSDITTSVAVHLLDEDGNEVTDTLLERNPENVMVTIEILEAKNVPIRIESDGIETAEGYGLTGVINASKSAVAVAGRKNAVASLNEIVIPASALTVKDAVQDTTISLNLRDYLPDGVSLAKKSDNALEIVVGIEKLATADMELDGKRVYALNISDQFEAELVDVQESYPISITGIESAVAQLGDKTLTGYADLKEYMTSQELTELSAGTYNVPIRLSLPEHVQQIGTVVVKVHVTEKQESN